jgi:2-polyprenyl-3-methyl-5-hydroxy-6-metoxy-1,4-benzoquinol methylase
MNQHTSHHCKEHFNLIAPKYLKEMRSFPWAILKSKEANIVMKLSQDISNKTILDLGAGPGYYSAIFLDHGAKKVTAVDFSKQMCDELEKLNLNAVMEPIETYKTSEQYDIILALGVLEFINNPYEFLENIKPMLSSNGSLIILIPKKNIFSKIYKIFHQRHNIELTIWGKTERLDAFSSAGFYVDDEQDLLPFSYVARLKKVT